MPDTQLHIEILKLYNELILIARENQRYLIKYPDKLDAINATLSNQSECKNCEPTIMRLNDLYSQLNNTLNLNNDLSESNITSTLESLNNCEDIMTQISAKINDVDLILSDKQFNANIAEIKTNIDDFKKEFYEYKLKAAFGWKIMAFLFGSVAFLTSNTFLSIMKMLFAKIGTN